MFINVSVKRKTKLVYYLNFLIFNEIKISIIYRPMTDDISVRPQNDLGDSQTELVNINVGEGDREKIMRRNSHLKNYLWLI